MNHGSLFSGIGGFDLAAQWMEWKNIFHCEKEPFCQKVLKYHFPKSILHDDIKTTDFTIYRGKIDILTGGFPCQPFSNAGKRKGTEDDRHLWPEMLRAIREIQPRWIVGENVYGLINWSKGLVFEQVQIDLENEGYEVTPYILPACAVNAPHRRDRIWFVAYSNGTKQRNNNRADNSKEREVWRGNNSNAFTELFSNGITSNSDITPTEHAIPTRGNLPESKIKHATTNTQSKGFQEPKQSEQSEQLLNVERDNTQDVANPNSSIGCKRGMHKPESEETERYVSALNARDYERQTWDNFPTQSPICIGNDGIPAELDGITFSKWRNESIKAGGNAIVPQVVYYIFKAIEEYENKKGHVETQPFK